MILLVDDDKDILDTYKDLLELSGYSVSAHLCPISALNAFKEHATQFNTIITDFHMPNMNGLELIQAVHNKQPSMKSILCSGMPPKDVPNQVAVLKKPSNFRELLNELAVA